MKEEIEHQIRYMPIEETFVKEKEKVYWLWRFMGEVKWRKELTPYKDIPYVKLNLTNHNK